MKISGIGSSSSFTNGAAIVMDLETSTIMLMYVALTLNGKTRSSSNADWIIAVYPTCIVIDIMNTRVGVIMA